MRLRNISIFFIVGIALINLLASCNDSETDTIASTSSADTQIYSFSATYIPRTHNDSVLYRPALAKAKFAINQSTRTVYNVDSLPYGFDVKKIAASISFSSSTPSATQVVYKDISAADSIVDWSAATDSIDFMILPNRNPALNGIPQVEFKVTAQNGTSSDKYTIKLLIHQVDPEEVVWEQKTDLPQSHVYSKALYINNEYYFYTSSDDDLVAYKSADGNSWSAVGAETTFPANIRVESLSLLGNDLYVTDITNNVYKSSDLGATWNTTPVATNVLNIIGQVYTSSNEYQLVAIIEESEGAKLALTSDFLTFSNQISLDGSFPVSEFSSIYDSKDNRLLVTGGKKKGATDYQNTTWWVTAATGSLEAIVSNKSQLIPFNGGAGLVTYLYDNKLYAWARDKETGNNLKLYLSDGGLNWIVADSKQYFDEHALARTSQSVIIDKDGYIWTFGGNTSSSNPTREVWRGMMRKIGFKK